MNLSTPIEQIPRIGPQYQKKLKKLGIKSVRDLIFHLPRRYEDFSNIISISEVELGKFCCLYAKILELKNTRTWKKKMILTQALVSDKSSTIKVIWFNQPYLINALKEGDFVCLAGKVALGPEGIYLSSPAYEKISNYELGIKNYELIHTGRLVPVYPETEGLSSRWLRAILKPILINLRNKIPETIPSEIIKSQKLLPINKAIWQVHFPDSINLAKKAQERFAFEELFIIQLFVLREKLKIAREMAFPIPLNLELCRNFLTKLPFKLTDAQKRALWQILKDLEKTRPMNRLLEGDVGSGKTIVATVAILNSARAGFQNAFMAPTEILAEQHFKTIFELLNPVKKSKDLNSVRNLSLLPQKIGLSNGGKTDNLKIGLLTSQRAELNGKKITKKNLLEKVREGEIDILIGTHSLIQEEVKFKKLTLVIVDEQHRFGVEQRAKLVAGRTEAKQKGETEAKIIPHLLSMTATPIPRTLALTLYGDLDLSLIDELPKGRKKIITKIILPKEREKTYDFIRKEVRKGRQVFVICPRIEPANNEQGTINNKQILSWTDVKAVKEEYEKLSKDIFSDLKIAQLHGKMKSEEKEKIMKDFKSGKIDILVSTSVIEVGIDVPNATIMMIEGAERFGLAQLHQFRGRVGRGEHQSYCFLFTESPAKKTAQRLKALISSENGFELAEMDLKIRGPGDFLGTRQWGIPDLAMDSLKDIFLVEQTRNLAKKLLEEDPGLKRYPLLKQKLEEFRQRVHLE